MEMMAGITPHSLMEDAEKNIYSGPSEVTFSRPLYRFAGARRSYLGNKCRTKNMPANTAWIGKTTLLDEAADFRLLLIGHDQYERKIIRNTLSLHLNIPIEFMETGRGDIALRTVGSETVDMIIFADDILDMNGIEFLEHLNRKIGKSKIPVIEILDSGATSAGVQAMKMGAHDYLLKDFNGQHFELLPILVSRIYTERQAINALRQTANVHQTITDSIPSVIYRLSLQGGHHDVCISPQFSELGFSVGMWGGDAELHHRMCHEGDRDVVKKALDHSYRTGATFQCEYRVNIFGNTPHWFHDKAKVTMDKYGRPLLLQGVMTDISGLKALEVELAQYRYMLDKMVRQRTERLDCRVAVLESCNLSLSENYDKMRQMYLDALRQVQAYEALGSASGIA